MESPPIAFIVMGVCGSGKSTVGRLVAKRFGFEFAEGDSFHPPQNVEKMSGGIPLSDADREPWLEAMNLFLRERVREDRGVVLACSALKKCYRRILRRECEDQIQVVYLRGTKELLQQRLNERVDHFMPPKLLESQLAALEEPEDAITCCISEFPDELARQIWQRANDED